MADALAVNWFTREPGGSTTYVSGAGAPGMDYPPIRLRCHTNGRFAVGLPGPLWLTSTGPDISKLTTRGDDRDCAGPGWSELLVGGPVEGSPEPSADSPAPGVPKWAVTGTEHAVYCYACRELECVHCHDFNGTGPEIDEHARTCIDRDWNG